MPVDLSSEFPSRARSRYARPLVVIERETAWRRITYLSNDGQRPEIGIGHWSQRLESRHELSVPPLVDHYTVDVLLNDTHVDCFRNGRQITTGAVTFGSTQVSAPGQEIRCCFEHSCEAIHLFVPRSVVVTAYEDIRQQRCPAGFSLDDPGFAVDPLLGRLALALVDASSFEGPFAALYSENLSMAVLARLLEAQSRDETGTPNRGGLASWRLNRAIDFMEANLAESITLRVVAEHAGLSRMHFAAQFKTATGLSPHAFMLNRRIEKAKQMLLELAAPLSQIAFEVGFQSQGHFTTVFRKYTGTTPGRWRAQTTSLEATCSSDSHLGPAHGAPIQQADKSVHDELSEDRLIGFGTQAFDANARSSTRSRPVPDRSATSARSHST